MENPIKLTRIMAQGRRFIPEVDGLRFVAITAVLLFHIQGYTAARHMTGASVRPWEAWLPRLLGVGHFGVQLFFALSGFLLALPFAKWRLGLGLKPSFSSYYLRRLTRLEPPYALSMLLLFAGGFVALGFGVGISHWRNLLASLLYQHNLIYGTGSAINVVAWSLEIEVQFYMLAPFLTVVFSMREVWWRRALLLAVVLAVPALRTLAPEHYRGLLWLSVAGQLEYFAAGFLLADLFLVDWKQSPAVSWAWDVTSVVSWMSLVALLLMDRLTFLVAPCVLLAYVGAFRGKISSRIFRVRLLTILGGMCYSMYLLHYAVISVTGRFSSRVPFGSTFTQRFAVEATFAIPAVLGAALLFFIFIERPCMDPAWPFKLAERYRRLGWGSRSTGKAAVADGKADSSVVGHGAGELARSPLRQKV